MWDFLQYLYTSLFSIFCLMLDMHGAIVQRITGGTSTRTPIMPKEDMHIHYW